MTDDKLYSSLSVNTIMAKLTNHVERTRFITSSTDKHYSLDSEDDFRSGCRNVSHQQQFFSELLSPGRSHYTNYNFIHKLQKLQTNLDLWRARDLTLFGRVLIIKSLALSQLVYSASNLSVPQEITPIIKTKLFKFLWKNKNDKIKREGLYQDRDKGGIRMIDVETMMKAFWLAWISRLLAPGKKNWKTIPDYYLGRYGGLSFLLRCTYCTKYIDGLPSFCKVILMFFNELKTLYNYDRGQDMILFNNKEILVGGKPIFISEWFNNNILFIQDLLDSNGQLMSYQEFKNKFACKRTSNFIRF